MKELTGKGDTLEMARRGNNINKTTALYTSSATHASREDNLVATGGGGRFCCFAVN